MPKRMAAFQWAGKRPTLGDVKKRFDLSDDDLDAAFGVVQIDPQDNTYAVVIEDALAQRLEARHGAKEGSAGEARDAADTESTKGLRGPYSNPRIEPFGPPRHRSEE